MKKGLKQAGIATLLFVFMLAALFIPNKNVHADTVKKEAGTVVIDVERFTIGQGFYLEPEQMPFYEGENLKDLLERFIGTDKMIMNERRMEGIKGADLGIDLVKVPDYISQTKINGPTTEQAKEFGNGNNNDLEEHDYFSLSGWVYWANNADPVTGIEQYKLKDGDVIRMQFTLVLGVDLSGVNFNTQEVLCTISNKDEAIKEIARINSSAQKQKLLADSTIKSNYENLKKSVQNAVIPQSELDNEVSELKKAVDEFLAEKPENPTPTEPENPTPTEPENPTPTEPENPAPTEPENPTPTEPENPTPTEPENPTPTDSVNPTPSKPTVSPKPSTKPSIKVGTTVKSSTGKEYVKVTSTSKKTVQYVKPAKKTYTNVTIPATVKIFGKTYKVTAISANAFKGMTKLKKVTIGKNVGKIGVKAFYKCKNLSQITIASTTLSSGKVAGNAFSGTKKKAVVKVPKSKYNAYKKFLLKKGNKTIRVKK